MPNYISAIFLDFDNVFSSLFSKSSNAAVEFAESPALWLGALQGMKGSEVEDTNHNFVIRRCYMNPAGRVPGSKYFSVFRQSFVRDGWEVIDTPPLTNQGKTSADTHIVMDVLDAVAQFPHVSEYVILAADADYTPLIIRLRKYMKTTVIYAPAAMSVAYRAACDSVIEEQEMLNLLQAEEGPEAAPAQQPVVVGEVTPEKIKHTVDRYFAESEPDHKANVATLGHLLIKQFPGIENGWANHTSLSQLLRKTCLLDVQKVENRTLASKPIAGTN